MLQMCQENSKKPPAPGYILPRHGDQTLFIIYLS